MNKFGSVVLALMVLGAFAGPAMSGEDTLSQVKRKGVLVAGVKDSLPPFGYIDEATRRLVGYDVDFVRAIADKLGVKLQLKPVSSAGRIPQLMGGNIDIIAATTSKTPPRMEQIDFSHAYFFTVQKFLVKTGTVKTLADLEGKKIGTAKGSDSEQNVAQALPSATILSFDDYPQAFLALQQGKVFAVTTDAPILAGIRGKAPNKEAFEIPDLQIYDEAYGLGMRKGDKAFVDFVNKTLVEMEENGQALKIFDKWFGPGTATPLKRTFTITADK
jgi:polar amino acid transport system substrate-binding protein